MLLLSLISGRKLLLSVIALCEISKLAVSEDVASADYSHHCSVNRTETDTDSLMRTMAPQCASCKDRCGSASRFFKHIPCSCDRLCVSYNDCCPDFQQVCLREYDTRQYVDVGHPACRPFESFFSRDQFLLISTCSKDELACNISNNGPTGFIPVYDEQTGIHFTNYRCALCNGVRQPRPWHSVITCVEGKLPREDQNLSSTITEEEFAMIWNKYDVTDIGRICRLHVEPEKGSTEPRQCVSLTRQCSEDCPNEAIQAACHNGPLVYVGDSFANPLCILCELGSYPQGVDCRVRFIPGSVRPPASAFSFQLLFDVDVRDGLTVGRKKPSVVVMCPPGQTWVADEETCRYMTCSGELHNCSSSDITIKLSATGSNMTVEEWKRIEKDLPHLLEQKFETSFNVTFFLDTHNLSAIVKVTSYGRHIFTSYELETAFASYINTNFSSKQFKVYIFNCSLLLYDESEYIHNADGTIYLLQANRKVAISDFYIIGSRAHVCSEKPEEVWSTSDALGYVTIVFTGLSICALIIRLILECFVHVKDKAAARIQVSLVGALLLGMVSFLIHPFIILHQGACVTVAVLIHWSFLAAFTWMTIMACDIIRMLYASQHLQRLSRRNVSFVAYSVIGWGFPAILAALAISLDFSDIPIQWKAQYGRRICWISGRYGLLIFFVVPAALEFLLNVIIFIVAIIYLRVNKKDVSGHRNTKSRLILHVRLLVLMGITWLFAFLAIPFSTEVLWYLFVILNASQGVFLLATFLMSSAARESLCQRRANIESKEGSSKRTESTQM